MKAKYLLSVCALILIFASLGACKEKEIIDDGSSGNIEPETSITFTCLDDTLELSGVLVGITPNAADRENGVFLYSGTTNSRGIIKFSKLAALTYYYSASWSAPNGVVVRKGQLTIEKGDKVDRDIKF